MVTPIYVATEHDAGLLNVLVAGIAVDASLAQQLKSSTGESEFVFLTGGRVNASTLNAAVEHDLTAASTAPERVNLAGTEYYQFVTPLAGIEAFEDVAVSEPGAG